MPWKSKKTEQRPPLSELVKKTMRQVVAHDAANWFKNNRDPHPEITREMVEERYKKYGGDPADLPWNDDMEEV